jgi:signal transduction histidine kinase
MLYMMRPVGEREHVLGDLARGAGGNLAQTVGPARRPDVVRVELARRAYSAGACYAARERQAALEQERTLFVSAVAHDLRAPLFALRSYLEGLETEDEPCVTVSATCPVG